MKVELQENVLMLDPESNYDHWLLGLIEQALRERNECSERVKELGGLDFSGHCYSTDGVCFPDDQFDLHIALATKLVAGAKEG